MSATILSGTTVREARIPALIERIGRLSFTPKLAIIQVGDRPDSTAFIRMKKAFAEKIGVQIEHVHLAETISQDELVEHIHQCNSEVSIQGIIVQLPLPPHIDRDHIIEMIDPRKDVDGLTTVNQKKLATNDSSGVIPATARGIKELLDYYKINLKGDPASLQPELRRARKVVVVGRSKLVGTPVAWVCKNAGAEVIVCHSKTPDLATETTQADIVIVAVGKANLIGADHVRAGQVIIDVGINTVVDVPGEGRGAGHMVGDVDFSAVKNSVAAITPVPGGVGPLTVLALFENLVDACK